MTTAKEHGLIRTTVTAESIFDGRTIPVMPEEGKSRSRAAEFLDKATSRVYQA